MSACVSPEGDAEGSEPVGDVGVAGAEFGCDVGESPVAGHVLLVEPVAVHLERRAGLCGAAAGNSVFVEKGDDGAPAGAEPAAELLGGDFLGYVEVAQVG